MRKYDQHRDREETSAQALLREVRELREALDALIDRMPEGVQPASPAFIRQMQADRKAQAEREAKYKARLAEQEAAAAVEWQRLWDEQDAQAGPVDRSRLGVWTFGTD